LFAIALGLVSSPLHKMPPAELRRVTLDGAPTAAAAVVAALMQLVEL